MLLLIIAALFLDVIFSTKKFVDIVNCVLMVLFGSYIVYELYTAWSYDPEDDLKEGEDEK